MTAVVEPQQEAPSVAYCERRLRDVVHRLVEDQPVWDPDAGALVEPGLYRMTRSMLTAVSARSGASSVGSKLPARVDVIDWLARFDAVVASWSERSLPTVQALRAIAAASHGPDQVSMLMDRAGVLERFAAEAERLCGLVEVSVPLRGHACPRCSQRVAYRSRSSESVRTTALTAAPSGVECHACGAQWRTESELAILRGMLGIETAVV